MKEITTIDELKEIVSSDFKYIIGYYDNKTDTYIVFDIFDNPITCIRNLKQFLDTMHLPLVDVELHMVGRIDSTGLVSNLIDCYLLNPKLYFKELGEVKQEE